MDDSQRIRPTGGATTAVAPGERGIDQTFGRAAAILDALSEARDDGLRFTDIVQATGFSKATVHRLMAGLTGHGLVEAEERSGRYFLGYRLSAWGAAARDRHGLVQQVGPILDRLAEATGDTIYFSVRTGVLSLCVARRVGPSPIRVLPLAPGDRNALGVGSASLALLAFIESGAEIDRILADPANVAARERRGLDEATVRTLVRAARKRGYAMVEDLVPGIVAIGVPVHARAADPVAAVAIATIAARLAPPRREEAVERLRAAAKEIGPIMRDLPDLTIQL